MKFYVTTEGVVKIKKSILNLKLFSIINVPEILEKNGYTYSTIDDYGSFIISDKINTMMKCYSKSKRIRGIFYSNPSINEELLPNLFQTVNELENITEIVLLDDYHIPKLKHLYSYFDEIIFYPSIKKIRLIEAIDISKLIDYKFNSHNDV
jgi:hypothetical protein